MILIWRIFLTRTSIRSPVKPEDASVVNAIGKHHGKFAESGSWVPAFAGTMTRTGDDAHGRRRARPGRTLHRNGSTAALPRKTSTHTKNATCRHLIGDDKQRRGSGKAGYRGIVAKRVLPTA